MTATTVGATKEPGEPNANGNAGGHSIWYTYTPTSNHHVTFDTCGSAFDTLLGVYTGNSVGGLTPVVANDDTEDCGGAGSNRDSLVAWYATSGTTYRIQVDGYNGAEGAVKLNWANLIKVIVPWSAADNTRLNQIAAFYGKTPAQIQKDGVSFLAFLVGLSGNTTPTPWVGPPPIGTDAMVASTWTMGEGEAIKVTADKYVVSYVNAHRLGVYFISFLLALGGN